jgi:hypothetical protein
MVALPSTLAITTNTASDLVFTGADLDAGNGNADEALVLSLSVASGVLSASNANSVTVDGTATARTFTGTAANLEAYLQAGALKYNGAADGLGLSLARAAEPSGASTRTAVALQGLGAQSVGGNAVVALELPATLVTTAGATIALPFGGTPLAAAGPVTLSFAASASVTLSWDADSDLRVSSTVGAAAMTSGSGAAATLSLYGTAAQLNAYLSAGKLKASLSGTSAGSVSVTLNGSSSGIVRRAADANVVPD